MREILFRAKSVWGNWCEGYLVKMPTYFRMSTRDDLISFGVDAKTIGQYTGLTDKNGKKIFEGDVVLYPWNDQDKPERFTIKFKDGQFVASPVKETEDYWDFMVGGYSKEMEAIGNIHDNQELLWRADHE